MKQVDSLFFGSSDHLFGLYHPAIGLQRNHGIVICAPLFHEYYRTHFAVKRVASDLAAKGYDVLRFDYTGIGDSKGDLPPDMFNRWSADIGEAMTELRQLGGSTDISLVGLRFSASLGLPWHTKVSKYVCWDAIPDHSDYAKQLDATNSTTLDEHDAMTADEVARHTDNDYLGTGLSRTSIHESLAKFSARSDAQWPAEMPAQRLDIQSDSDWVSPSLKRIYAHESSIQIVEEL